MTNLPRAWRDGPGRRLRPGRPRTRRAPALGRRHPQVPVPPARRPDGRERDHPHGAPRHLLHLQPGGLRHGLPLLRHGPRRAGARSRARARSSSRCSAWPRTWRRRPCRATATAPSTWSSWAWANRWTTWRHGGRDPGDHGRPARGWPCRARRIQISTSGPRAGLRAAARRGARRGPDRQPRRHRRRVAPPADARPRAHAPWPRCWTWPSSTPAATAGASPSPGC